FSSRRRHTRFSRDWSSDVCSSDLFYVLDKAGKVLPRTVEIENNNAKITLKEPVTLAVGDEFTVVVEAGLRSQKELAQAADGLTLFRLTSEQRVDFVYRGARPEAPRIQSIVPRRVPAGKTYPITVAMIGVPVNKEQ